MIKCPCRHVMPLLPQTTSPVSSKCIDYGDVGKCSHHTPSLTHHHHCFILSYFDGPTQEACNSSVGGLGMNWVVPSGGTLGSSSWQSMSAVSFSQLSETTVTGAHSLTHILTHSLTNPHLLTHRHSLTNPHPSPRSHVTPLQVWLHWAHSVAGW